VTPSALGHNQRRAACGASAGAPGWLDLGNLEVFTDLPSEIVIDLAMPGDSGGLTRGSVDVDRVAPSLTEESASMALKMADKVEPLHSSVRTRGSRMTS